MKSPTIGRILITLFFALLCLNAWAQVILALVTGDGDPLLLRTWQAVSGAGAFATAVGAYRLRPWSPWAALVFGIVTGAMIFALGPMLELEEEARGGLLPAALAVVAICGGMALYLRRLLRRTG